MRYKIIIIVIVILTIIIIASLVNGKSVENIIQNQYTYNNLKEVKLSEVDLNRYNEKVNIDKITESIINLDMLADNDILSLDGIVKYAIYYAENFDYKFDEFSYIENEKLYVNRKYIKDIIENLFNISIDFSKLNEIKTNGDNLVILKEYYIKLTDIQLLNVEKLLYDSERQEYIIYINYINSIDMNLGNIEYDLNNIERDLIERTICLRYSKEKTNYTILDYFEIKE